MTVDEALTYADEWAKLLPNDSSLVNYPLDGWRVVCKILADEVRDFRNGHIQSAIRHEDRLHVCHACDGTGLVEGL